MMRRRREGAGGRTECVLKCEVRSAKCEVRSAECGRIENSAIRDPVRNPHSSIRNSEQVHGKRRTEASMASKI